MPDYVSPPALKDIITEMTAIEPEARPSLADVQRQLLVIRHAMHAQGDVPRFISPVFDVGTAGNASDISRNYTAPPSPWEGSSTGGEYSEIFAEGTPSTGVRQNPVLPFAARSPTDTLTLRAQSDRASTVEYRLTSAAPSPVATAFTMPRGVFGVALAGVADPEPPGTPNSGGLQLDQVRPSWRLEAIIIADVHTARGSMPD